VGRTVESVLAQTFRDFELVIIDNASTDDSARQIETFSDPRIRFLRNPQNLGAEANWNRCLGAARGRYIKLLPADDLIYPDCLETQLSPFQREGGESLALCYGGRDIIDEADRRRMTLLFGGEGRIAAAPMIRKTLRSGTNVIGPGGCVLFSATAARDAGHFSDAHPFVIDLDFWCRLLLHGDAYVLPHTVSAFRISAGSWTVSLGQQQSRDYCAWVDELRRRNEFSVGPVLATVAKGRARLNGLLRGIVTRRMLRR
jgi:glycosyltransferase involved in cell wall biosynthesis